MLRDYKSPCFLIIKNRLDWLLEKSEMVDDPIKLFVITYDKQNLHIKSDIFNEFLCL